MQLEELNKSQIVLLTLLVSFVTSIATGIVTVSLVEKAPADVTRVIQRVVERTVEKVSPGTQQATVITREKTIIIKEADLIAAAIASNKNRIVNIVQQKTGKFEALGVFINTKGTLVTDASVLDPKEVYAISIGTDTLIPLTITNLKGARGIALLHTGTKKSDAKPILISEVPLHLGQTLVSFIGRGSITQGIVSKLGNAGYISTSANTDAVTPGSILLNVDGEVVGISTGVSRKISKETFAPMYSVLAKVAGTATTSVTSTSTTATTTTQNKKDTSKNK